MSAIYTLMLATEQGTHAIKMEPRAILITGLCIAAGLFVLIFGMWITRPKKTDHRVTKKQSSLNFEWLPVAIAHFRHKFHPAPQSSQNHNTE